MLVPKTGEELPVLTEEASDIEIENHAKATHVRPERVRDQFKHGRPLAGSYAALVVRLKGQPWGVLVLDSRTAGTIDVGRLKEFRAYGNLLTPLLERV